MKIAAFSILIMLSFNAFSQTGIDSVFANYLKQIREIDSIEYRTIPKKAGYDFISNFYIKRLDSFKVNKSSLLLVKFGSYTSDVRPHLGLIDINSLVFTVFDGLSLKEDVLSLFEYMKSFSLPSEKDFNKFELHILNRFLKVYSVDW